MERETKELRVGENARLLATIHAYPITCFWPPSARTPAGRSILKLRIAAFPPYSNQFEGVPIQGPPCPCASVGKTPFQPCPRPAFQKFVPHSCQFVSKPIPTNTKNYQTNPFCHHELSYNHNGLFPISTKPSRKTNSFSERHCQVVSQSNHQNVARISSICLLPSSLGSVVPRRA